jgi:hypothetical protein
MDTNPWRDKLDGVVFEFDLTKWWLKFEKFMRKLIEGIKK